VTAHPFATVDVTAAEVAAGSLSDDRLHFVVSSLRDHGAAIINDAVDPDHVDALYEAMTEELHLAAEKPPALDTRGHVQHNPPLHAEHLYPDVFANPIALQVTRALLGPSVQLSVYTGNTMLGGTTDAQPLHWDDYQLWGSALQAPAAAPHSTTVNLALVDVEVENGAIELWPGTHFDARSGDRLADGRLVPDEWAEARRREVPPVRVPLGKGGLLLRDGRVWHRGTTNTTDRARPMVAMVYFAWWYRPLAIDFYPDAEPVLRASGLSVAARYRAEFDHHEWPPNFKLVPAPID